MSVTTHIGFGPFKLSDFQLGDLFARFDSSLAKVCDPQPVLGRPDHIQVWIDFGTANARKEWLHCPTAHKSSTSGFTPSS